MTYLRCLLSHRWVYLGDVLGMFCGYREVWQCPACGHSRRGKWKRRKEW